MNNLRDSIFENRRREASIAARNAAHYANMAAGMERDGFEPEHVSSITIRAIAAGRRALALISIGGGDK